MQEAAFNRGDRLEVLRGINVAEAPAEIGELLTEPTRIVHAQLHTGESVANLVGSCVLNGAHQCSP